MRFVAALNTYIFGVYYEQGAEVDTTGWTRKMLLQFLELGIIQAAYLTTGAISDRLEFNGDGVTTEIVGGKIVVTIDPEFELPPINYAGLADVDMSGLTDGQIPAWDADDNVWRPINPPAGGGGGGSVSDPRWNVPAGWTSVDEFDDGSLHAAWTLAGHTSIPGGSVPTYAEGNGVLSVAYTGAAADGATARHHAIVRPIGSTLANGEGYITSFRALTRNGANYRMMGLVLSTSGSSGAGNQLYSRWHNGGGGSVGFRSLTSWGGDTVLGVDHSYPYVTPLYVRIVRVSSTTWRTDYSPDGVQWLSNSVATWSNEPTHVGFCHSNWNTTTPSVGSYEFLRRVSGVS